MSLTKKIIIYITILGLFPIIGISFLYFLYFEPRIKLLIDNKIKVVSEVVGDDIYREILKSVQGVALLSKSEILSNPDSTEKECGDEIEKNMMVYRIFKDITFLDSRGDIIASGNYLFRELSSTSWFKKALNIELVISDVHSVLYPYELTMTVSSPVICDKGSLIGVIVAHLNLTSLNEIVKQIENSTGYEIWILDNSGRAVISPYKKKLLELYEDAHVLKKSLNREYYTFTTNRDSVEIFTSLSPIKNSNNMLKLDWSILAIEDTSIIYKVLERFKMFFLIRGIISLVLFIFIFIYLSRSLKNRIDKLKEVTVKLGHGDFSAEITDDGKDEVSELINVFSNTRDFLKSSEECKKRANERFKLAVKGAKDVIWDWDVIDDKLYIGHKWWDILGIKNIHGDYITMNQFKSYINPDDLSFFGDKLNSYFLNDDDYFDVEYRINRPDGGVKWILSRGILVKNSNGIVIRMAGSHTDITSRKIMEQKMAFNAYYDTLTELPNRNMLLDRLEEALSRASRSVDFSFSVLFLDFDGFKHINDTYGHDVGDQLLIEIGIRLKDCIRPMDIVARIGGDEFVILIDGVGNEKELIPILNRIIITSKNEFLIKEKSIFTSVSIGVAVEKDGTSKPDQLIQNSDIAMYHSKVRGKSRFTFFTEKLRKEETNRWSLEHELHKALGTKELQVYYQPIVETSSGKLYGFEALMRWNHPTKGVISPIDFISAAEDTGFITNMTKWLITEICHQQKKWQLEGYNIRTSFNVTAKDFFINGGLDRFLDKILKTTGVSPNSLALEVTESVMIKDFENVTKQLRSLRKMGISIKLDDFGTGYSSLSYLNKFEIDYIKIDKSFIQSLSGHSLSKKIVKSIIALAKDVKLKTIAEGVEIEKERSLLKKWGCDYIQGYYYSKPLSLTDVSSYLKELK